ncbi:MULTISPECIES: hypothetical protein [unclassified Burkholderia]|uniref:oxidoreductase n=1 Tax=unclassified Burkholderia TaxID=2613784 RepID=UPI00214FFB96|nr:MULTISPECIES: hypothetical protein [unclassified Burkholderia]MCR4471795.1 hypothetical protein [Burkholderia sp. SCN-KJ]
MPAQAQRRGTGTSRIVPVQRLHAYGAVTISQIMHSGVLTQATRYKNSTVAPSAIQPPGEQLATYCGSDGYRFPLEMSYATIVDANSRFAETARRAASIEGFDSIKLHAANGYLLDQFISSAPNQRTYRWGRDTRSQLTFVREVIYAVSATIDDETVLGIRASPGNVNNFASLRENGERDAEAIVGTLTGSDVDYIYTTLYRGWQPTFPVQPGSLAELARSYAPSVPVIAYSDLLTRFSSAHDSCNVAPQSIKSVRRKL